MLSPGLSYKHVPKDLAANLQFRIELLEAVEFDQNLQRGLIDLCAQDILFWINTFVWQKNPRHVGNEVGPFITWDFQEEVLLATLLRLFEDEDDMLWEKSREMGATWMALLISVWLTLFHPHKRVLFISHSEEAVVKAGDEGTLFAKVQFIMDKLPGWMTKGYKKWKKGYRMANGSNISASASTERSGVGDRCSFVLLDEFSKQRDAYAILGQTADTGPRLFIGTHYEVGGAYYDLTQRPDMHKRVLHWSQHPEKRPGRYQFNPTTQRIDVLDKSYKFPADYQFVMDGMPTGGPYPGLRTPWYDKECKRRNNSRDVAMHLDIDPAGSQSQVFDPLTVSVLKQTYARRPDFVADLMYDPVAGVPLERNLVADPQGRIHCWFVPNMHGLPPIGRYVVGVDPSTGSGATPSCVEVLNVETGEQAAEYVNPFMDEQQLAPFVVALCRVFAEVDGTPARLIWESPGPGLPFGKKVLQLGFYHVYYRTDELKAVVSREVVTPGWFQTPSGKKILLSEIKESMRTRQTLIYSEEVYDECLKFKYDPSGNPVHSGEYNTNDPSGARVNHGDRVMALSLARWIAKGYSRQVEAVSQAKPGIGSLAGRRLFEDNRRREQEAWA